MTGPEAGGGSGGDLRAQLAQLPAALQGLQDRAVAEAVRVAEGLLRDHYALYHRGGGGGGLVELGRAVATAGQVDLRVPASGALPTGYGALQLVATGRSNGSAGDNRRVYVRFNDDSSAGPYNYTYTYGDRNPATVAADGSSSDAGLAIAYAPAVDSGQPQTVFAGTGHVPLHEGTVFPKVALFSCAWLLTASGTGGGPHIYTTTGVYAPTTPGPITSVILRCLTAGWRVDSTVIVYGYPEA